MWRLGLLKCRADRPHALGRFVAATGEAARLRIPAGNAPVLAASTYCAGPPLKLRPFGGYGEEADNDRKGTSDSR